MTNTWSTPYYGVSHILREDFFDLRQRVFGH